MSEILTSAGSWPSKLESAKDGVSAGSLGGLVDGGVPVEASGAPLEDEDFELEFPLENFQFELGEANLDRLWYQYQILPEFGLEVPLSMDRACNPPLRAVLSGWVEACTF